MDISKLTEEDLKNYKRDIAKKCVDCVERGFKLLGEASQSFGKSGSYGQNYSLGSYESKR